MRVLTGSCFRAVKMRMRTSATLTLAIIVFASAVSTVTLRSQTDASLIGPATAAKAIFTIPGGSVYHRENCEGTGGHSVREISRSALTSDNVACPYCEPNGWTAWKNQYAYFPSMRGAAMTANRALAPSSDVDGLVRAKCAKDWETDFQMRAFCEKTQRESIAALNGRTMNAGDRLTIRTKCAGDWPDDFKMRDFCEGQQLEALKQLGR